MNYILFDGPSRNNLLPLTFTRPVAEIRVGILTIREKWQHVLGTKIAIQTQDYLRGKWPAQKESSNIFIDASLCPDEDLIQAIQELKPGERLVQDAQILAYFEEIDSYKDVPYTREILQIQHTWDIFSKNAAAIEADFKLLTTGRTSQPISQHVHVKNPESIFIEEGAEVEFCSLNASSGPIYIGKNAMVMEGTHIRGPFALGDHAIIKMGAKIYGPTTIGPNCKAGGEINNSVMFQNSNKGHDGFLGNSVLGEWCNLGADTNNSNLKNNYAEVRLWDYDKEGFSKTGLQFCGLIMGDHSKCAINTMFNTGTVIGVSANIFGSGFPRNFVPSFSWGGSAGMSVYKLDKVFETAELVLKRRNLELTDADKNILEHVFEETAKWRRF
ncbi:MAG: GlmU family protein [Christiangramia sp.]|uniref:GlmU family protein n=1 Tax=Christiangramia sp. TaxID=1931228 RepID=UPI003242D911